MLNLRIFRWTAACLIWLLAGLASAVGTTEPEDELKSATVLSFIRHAVWAQGDATGTITVGVVGRPSMIRVMRRTMDGKAANNRQIRVVDATASAELNSCQVVYVATSSSKEVLQTLAGLSASHALIIGETDRFLEHGGAVNLFLVDGHMSFEVSLEALDHAGVSISSTLLRYGLVKGRRPL